MLGPHIDKYIKYKEMKFKIIINELFNEFI